MTAKDFAALLAVYAFWGLSYVAVGVMVTAWPPLPAVAARYVLAGAVFAAWAACRRDSWRLGRLERRASALNLVLLMSGGAVLLSFALQAGVSAGVAALMYACTPLAVAAWLSFLRGQGAGRGAWGLLALGLCGLAVVVAGSSGSTESSPAGVALAALGALSWAAGTAAAHHLAPGVTGRPAAMAAEAAGAACLVAVAGAAAGQWGAFSLDVPFRIWAALACAALLASVLAYACYRLLIRRGHVLMASTAMMANPVVAAARGFLVLGQGVSVMQAAGGLMVLAALAPMAWSAKAGSEALPPGE